MMTATETMKTATDYIRFDLGDDTGAIRWIADAGTMRADDAAIVRVVYGTDADAVLAAIVSVCKSRVAK